MNFPNQIAPDFAGVNGTLLGRQKYFSVWIMLALLLAMGTVRTMGQDEDYLTVYGVIEQADALNRSGKTEPAHAKYVEAQRALAQFQRDYPGWNAQMVSFRLKYLAEKIADTSAQTMAAENNPAAATVKKDTAPAPKSPVKLLDAGSEPRTVLQLHPQAGDQQTVSMNMKMAMTMIVAGKAVPGMNIPAMLMTMRVSVKSVTADGDITYMTDFTGATVAADTNAQPVVVAAMNSALSKIQGMTGTGRMSSHGVIKDFSMKLPAGADPQLSQIMGQMKESIAGSATPLPEEAVGVGAKWEYATKIKTQGMSIEQSTTYELVSVEGDHITLRITLTQDAANQKISNPAIPGLKMDLDKMSGTGSGESTFDLNHIMPVSATLGEKSEIVMGMNVGQQKQAMTMTMNMDVTLKAQ